MPDQLDLTARFRVTPDRDAPEWCYLGFTHLDNLDIHVVKHVLGRGSNSPAAQVTWWSERLGTSIDPPAIFAELDAAGCRGWREVAPGHRGHPDPRPDRLYEGMSFDQRASCIAALAPLRERYMQAATEAVRARASITCARHLHLGTASAHTLYFLDDHGLVVIAKGPAARLNGATCFCALAPSETSLGPDTLKAQLSRALNLAIHAPTHAKLHSPLMWRNAP